MLIVLAALQLAAAQPRPVLEPLAQPSGRIAAILRNGDGLAKGSAWKVTNVDEEYQVLRLFGLESRGQSLVIDPDHRAYDVHDATDPRTGGTVQLWFDVTALFGG